MTLSSQLLDEAVRAHGHLGPFLVIGLRTGLLGKRLCNGEVQECRVETIGVKPPLCAVDGIKAAIGQATLSVKPSPGICAIFTATSGNRVAVRVKAEVLERYRSVAWERCEEAAGEVLRSVGEDLFKWLPKPRPTSKSSSGKERFT